MMQNKQKNKIDNKRKLRQLQYHQQKQKEQIQRQQRDIYEAQKKQEQLMREEQYRKTQERKLQNVNIAPEKDSISQRIRRIYRRR